MKYYTSIEQSKKLLELGLSLESADMHSEATEIDGDMVFMVVCGLGDKNKSNYGSPVWSLGALLELLREYKDCNKLNIFSNRSQKWQITISYYDVVWKEHEEINTNLLELVYDTVVWLLVNGYIKKE